MLTSADPSPTRPVRILALSGSVRVGSLNLGLLRAARELAPPDVDVTIAELADLPLYNQDLEAAGDPAPVQRLKAQVRAADAVLIATPEHNGIIPALLANALEWLSRPPRQSVLRARPLAIMGASPGRGGTARAQLVLRQVLEHAGPAVLERALALPHAGAAFDAAGNLIDPTIRASVQQLVAELAAAARGAAADATSAEHRRATLTSGHPQLTLAA